MLVWPGETFRKCNGLERATTLCSLVRLGRMETGVAGMPREREGRGKEEKQRGREACYGAHRGSRE